MINNNISVFLLNLEEKSGGLFDFDGTLPLTIFQFIILTFILERILYKPLSEIENLRVKNLKEKTQKVELTLSGANFLIDVYTRKFLNVEEKINTLLKENDAQIVKHFQKQIDETLYSGVNAILKTDQDIKKKIASLSSNENIKNTSTTIAAVIINQIISE